MTKDQAIDVFEKTKKCCKNVLISIPLGYYPQDEYEGNPYEKHITDNWSHQEVIDTFGEPTRFRIENEIGVYLYGEAPKMKIAVYAISKNEEQFVKRFCESAKDADVILIADTGSTDKTVELAKECGATVHNIFINPWRFDMARDTALALIPSDVDVCISLDLDEELQPGWREEIERVWKEDTTRLRYKFDWGCGIAFFYEKIHHRKGYRWHHPCHEYPTPDPRINEVWAHTDMLLVIHKPDPTKSRGQYLPLLELAVKEDPRCPRNAFYYARELTFYAKWLDAIVALNKYLAMPEATWVNERCYAMRLLGKCYDELGQDGREWLRKAAAEAPGTREPWVELAESAYRKSDWNECYSAAKKALAITNKEEVYTMNPLVWQALPHDMAAIAAHHLGFKEEAIKQGELALQFEPDNARLRDNLNFYQKMD
jgi:tetratricopeptide (TPR) repeat protein